MLALKELVISLAPLQNVLALSWLAQALVEIWHYIL